MKLRNLLYLTVVAFVSLGVVSCSDDDLDSESVFPDVDESLDQTSYTFQLDSFLKREYLIPYNLEFIYRMEDAGSDMDYNLVPARYDASVDLATLTKYLWFEAYEAQADSDFMPENSPRIIHLIGSPAFNSVNGTMVLGLAEGGIKVTLYRVNYIDPTDISQLNEYYLKTMHHEFAHILHQTKTYPTEFQTISTAQYDPMGWQDRDDRVCNSFGCVTAYASSESREDFAETVANYITKTDEEWAEIMYNAALNWETDGDGTVTGYNDDGEGGLDDGVAGADIITQKVSLARTWFSDSWGLDLDSLRAEVQRRQASIDIDSLRNLVYSIGITDTTE